MGNVDNWPEIFAVRCNSNGVLAVYASPVGFGIPAWELEFQAPAGWCTAERIGRTSAVVSFMARRRLRDRPSLVGG
jgi:hypothetical protein